MRQRGQMRGIPSLTRRASQLIAHQCQRAPQQLKRRAALLATLPLLRWAFKSHHLSAGTPPMRRVLSTYVLTAAFGFLFAASGAFGADEYAFDPVHSSIGFKAR